MARKRSKKKLNKWACPEGCDVSKSICKHLQDELDKHIMAGRLSLDTQQEYREFVLGNQNDIHHETKAKRIEKALEDIGLEDFRIELLMDRFVSNLTLGDIVKKSGYVSKSTVIYLLKDTLKLLRKMDASKLKQILGEYHGR